MSFQDKSKSEAARADANVQGRISQAELQQFVQSPLANQPRSSVNFTPQDVHRISSSAASGAVETITYEIGLDVAVAGFTQNPIEYEKYTAGANANQGHAYGVGADVGIGAPNVARVSNQYDAAAAMFHFADINKDGKIDPEEFGSFMRSV